MATRQHHVFVVTQRQLRTDMSIYPKPGLGAVEMLDATTGAVLHTTRLGTMTTPDQVIGNGPPHLLPIVADDHTNRVFVLSSGAQQPGDAGRVFVLDATTGRLMRTVTVGGAPLTAAVSPRTGHVFVVDFALDPRNNYHASGPGYVLMLDATTGRVLQRGHRPVPYGPVVVDDRTGRVFVGGESYLYTLDVTTGALLHGTSLPTNGCSMAVDKRLGRVIVASSTGRFTTTVSLADATTGAALRTIVVSGNSMCPAVVDEANGHAFALRNDTYKLESGYAVSVIDMRAMRIVQTTPLTMTTRYDYVNAQLAVDSSRGRVVVAAHIRDGVSRVLVLDADSGRLLAAIPVDAGSTHISPEEQIAIDEQTGRVFVSHYSAGTVSMLNASVGSTP